jgi:hypothetical protein
MRARVDVATHNCIKVESVLEGSVPVHKDCSSIVKHAIRQRLA